MNRAHRCNVWDVWVEHCPSMMNKQDIQKGKGLHLHVGTGRLVTEENRGTRGERGMEWEHRGGSGSTREDVGTPRREGKEKGCLLISHTYTYII